MRRSFLRVLAVTPQDYNSRFRFRMSHPVNATSRYRCWRDRQLRGDHIGVTALLQTSSL